MNKEETDNSIANLEDSGWLEDAKKRQMNKIEEEIKNLFSTDERLKKDYKLNLEGEEFIKYESDLFAVVFAYYNNLDFSIYYKTTDLLIYSIVTENIRECIVELERITKIYQTYEKTLNERNKIINDNPELDELFEVMDFWLT